MKTQRKNRNETGRSEDENTGKDQKNGREEKKKPEPEKGKGKTEAKPYLYIDHSGNALILPSLVPESVAVGRWLPLPKSAVYACVCVRVYLWEDLKKRAGAHGRKKWTGRS